MLASSTFSFATIGCATTAHLLQPPQIAATVAQEPTTIKIPCKAHGRTFVIGVYVRAQSRAGNPGDLHLICKYGNGWVAADDSQLIW